MFYAFRFNDEIAADLFSKVQGAEECDASKADKRAIARYKNSGKIA